MGPGKSSDRMRSGGRLEWKRTARSTASVVAFFVAWELIGRSENFFAIRPATEVLSELWLLLREGELWGPTIATLRIAAVGYAFAVAIGLVVGWIVGTAKLAADVLDPLIGAAYATPLSMLIPILGIYVGLEFRGKTVFVVLFCVFVITLNTAAGVKEVPGATKELGRSFGLSKWQVQRKIVFPAASPYVITGMRIGVGRAVRGALLADLLLRADGLGLYLIEAGSSFDMPRLLAATFFVTMLATSAMVVARLIESRVLRWKVA
jgi:ABC-type nitrate/sulfonate/bicarbonate transport system permease component